MLPKRAKSICVQNSQIFSVFSLSHQLMANIKLKSSKGSRILVKKMCVGTLTVSWNLNIQILWKISRFYASYCGDCVIPWLKTPAKIQRVGLFLHFCGLTSSEIYWCVFEKKNVFFPTFFEVSSCEFDQKNRFLKNEKNFVKNLQKRPFFCSFEGGKGLVSTPRFWRTPFWTLS